jgi:hypothetical protein
VRDLLSEVEAIISSWHYALVLPRVALVTKLIAWRL